MNTISIRDRIHAIRQQIVQGAQKAGREPNDIILIGVTKNQPVEVMQAAIEAGLTHLGENKVQEFAQKQPHLKANGIHFHLIGHLQSNKAKAALQQFEWIHSLDRLSLAEELQKQAEKLDLSIKVLIEVNTSGEENKFGVRPEDTIALVKAVASFPRIKIHGLMTVAAFLPNTELVRPMFQRLRELRTEIQTLTIPGVRMDHLSMGMTNDFQVAIEEGATMIRIGTALFGDRDNQMG